MTAQWTSIKSYTDIRYERIEGEAIAKITINRPEVRNAFRPETVSELIDAFDHAREDMTRPSEASTRSVPRVPTAGQLSGR